MTLFRRATHLASVIEETQISSASPSSPRVAENEQLNVNGAEQPLLGDQHGTTRPPSLGPAKWMFPCTIIALISVYTIVFLPAFQRRVPGSIMDVVHKDFDVQFIRDYSIFDLVSLTGVAGGPDYLLMLTFIIILII